MNRTELQEYLDTVFLDIKQATKELKEVIANKKLPLDYRWKLYLKYGKDFLEIDSWYFEPEGIEWGVYSLYNDFYYDRYSTVYADDMINTIEDKQKEDKWQDIDLDQVKESWLEKGIWGAVNNW